MFDVNVLAIITAALANMVLGFLWYHERVFGAQWMRAVRLTPDSVEVGKRRSLSATLFALLAALVMAYVLARFTYIWGVLTMTNALEFSLSLWIGLVVPLTLGPVLWEGKPLRLFFINAGYWLVTVVTMTLIVGLWW